MAIALRQQVKSNRPITALSCLAFGAPLLALTTSAAALLALAWALGFSTIVWVTLPIFLVFQSAVANPLIPRLSEALQREDRFAAAAIHRRLVADLAYFVIPCASGIALFAFFWPRQASSVGCYALWVLALIVVPDFVPRSRGETSRLLKAYTFILFLTLLVSALCASQLAVRGAWMGWVMVRIGSRLYAIDSARWRARWSWTEALPLRFLAKITALCAILVVGMILARALFGNSIAWFAGAGASSALVYIELTFALWRRERGSIDEAPIAVESRAA